MISFIKRIAIAICVVALPFFNASRADLVVKDGNNTTQTLFDFTCFTSKRCTAHVNINSSGTEIFTSGNAGYVQFPSAQAVSAAQSGNWGVRAQDGTGNALTSVLRGSERALSVQIVDGSGNQVTSFGGSGGTASNFGSPFPSSGTAAGFTDGTNLAAARVGDVNNAAAATNYLDVLGVGRYNAAQPTLTDTRYNALQLSSRGELLVVPGVSNFAVQAAQSGTWTITNISGTVSLPTGAATAANQTSVIGTKAAGTAATNSLLAGGVYSAGGVTLTDGQQASLQFTSAGRLLTEVGNANTNGQATMNNSSPVVPASDWVTVKAASTTAAAADKALVVALSPNQSLALQTAGGWSKKRLNALSTTVTAIKSSAAGQLAMLNCANPNASDAFVQVFDVATAGGVTLGTTVPDLSFRVPANNATGYALSNVGIQFANGIQVAATTTATGSSAPSTALDCNSAYN